MLEPARNPLALARYELKRFRGPLPRLALVFILLVPLLYGCIYLAGNWDPYGRLNHVPVAVVNQDRPTSFGDRQITAGDDFVKSLHEAGTFDFRDSEAAEAADGLAHDHDHDHDHDHAHAHSDHGSHDCRGHGHAHH